MNRPEFPAIEVRHDDREVTFAVTIRFAGQWAVMT